MKPLISVLKATHAYGNAINHFTEMTKISSSNFVSLLQILQQSTFYLKIVTSETKKNIVTTETARGSAENSLKIYCK